MEEKKKQESPKLLEFTSILAGIISAIVAAIAFYSSSTENKTKVYLRQTEQYEMEIAKLNHEISNVRQAMDNINQSGKKQEGNINVKAIETSLKDIKERQARIEDVILQNPSKALEMPLLRRDMDNLKDNQQSLLATVKQDMDRLYDLNKWLLGAMAISIITLAITNFIKGKEKG